MTPVALDFGWQSVGATSSAKQVIIFNSSDGPLAITGLNILGGNSGDFARTTTCPLSPSTLGAGAGCTVNITFMPTSAK